MGSRPCNVCVVQEKNCSHEVTVVLFSRTFYIAKSIGRWRAGWLVIDWWLIGGVVDWWWIW